MPYAQESDMYPAVKDWLLQFLRDRHRTESVRVFDASRKSLARLIQETGLIQHLPAEWPSWDIYVDVVGFVISKTRATLAFVECKNVAITLSHVSQLLGYSRVALPEYSFAAAPQGASDTLKALLLAHNRLDVLNYDYAPGKLPRSLIVAKWDDTAGQIDLASIITGGSSAITRI